MLQILALRFLFWGGWGFSVSLKMSERKSTRLKSHEEKFSDSLQLLCLKKIISRKGHCSETLRRDLTLVQKVRSGKPERPNRVHSGGLVAEKEQHVR